MASTTGQNFGTSGQRKSTETYASEAKEKGKEVMDKAKDVASSVAERASDMASNVAEGARKVGENIGERAQDAVHAVKSGIQHAGETIREYVPSRAQMADALDSTGRYVKEGLGHFGEDFTGMVRRNPVPALLVAAAIGFLLARATRS